MRAREVILDELDEIARLISDESGKPVAESLSMEIAPVLDLMQYFAKNAAKDSQAGKNQYRSLRDARALVENHLPAARRRRDYSGVELSVFDSAGRSRRCR